MSDQKRITEELGQSNATCIEVIIGQSTDCLYSRRGLNALLAYVQRLHSQAESVNARLAELEQRLTSHAERIASHDEQAGIIHGRVLARLAELEQAIQHDSYCYTASYIAGLERAAKMCDDDYEYDIAARIRSLKPTT